MKHIGIAGVTIPGSLLCIDTIVEESYKHFGADSMIHPRVTYTNPPLNEIEIPMVGKDWNQVAADLLESIEILHKAGVDFVIIPSNSPHYANKKVQDKAPVPVMSIVDVTVNECKARGFKKVGILGVNVTMSDRLYEEPLKKVGIEPIHLTPARQKAVSDLIYNEIIIGKPTAETANKLKVYIQELKDMGCDSFIAGCTEIPVVITSEKDSPLPFVDTTRVLAKKAFEKAAGLE
jgi:aspartate racemase